MRMVSHKTVAEKKISFQHAGASIGHQEKTVLQQHLVL